MFLKGRNEAHETSDELIKCKFLVAMENREFYGILLERRLNER